MVYISSNFFKNYNEIIELKIVAWSDISIEWSLSGHINHFGLNFAVVKYNGQGPDQA